MIYNTTYETEILIAAVFGNKTGLQKSSGLYEDHTNHSDLCYIIDEG